MRTLYSFHGGVHPPEHKAESCHVPLRHAGIPPLLVVPLNQSIGNPAKPCVHVGASVLAHQRIADADGRISVAVHAPTSGRVLAIEPRPFAHPSGLADLCIVPQLGNARRFGVEVRWPRLLALEAACLELPAFQNAVPGRQPDAE